MNNSIDNVKYKVQTNPKVSVMMACYNAEKYISEAIESILCQTFDDFELIILDDGSTDNSLSICEYYRKKDNRVKLFKNEKNYGQVYTRNKMMDMAIGEYLAVMDADDVSLPQRLEVQVNFLEKHDLIGGVSSGCYFINEASEVTAEMIQPGRTPMEVKAWLLFDNIILHSSAMFRKSIVKKNTLKYRAGQIVMQDYGMWTKFVLHSDWIVLEDKLIKYRNLSQSISHNMNAEKMKKSIQIESEIRKTYISDLGIKLKEKDVNAFLLTVSKFKGHFSTRKKFEIICLYVRMLFSVSDIKLRKCLAKCELRVFKGL